MPRRSLTNAKIGKTSSEAMRNAIRDVAVGGLSAKAASSRYNIPRTTLRRYLQKCKDLENNIDWNSAALEGPPRLTPNYRVNQIFSTEEEDILSEYLQTLSKLHHGLNPKSARKLAFDLAIANKKRIPNSWHINRTAGRLWFNGFMKRRRELSIRAAEATSLGRAMGFNKPIVERFFDNLRQIFESHNLGPHQIFNVDETALTTVQQTGKVVATKGQKQVGHITSSERGTLVTMCGCINAIGNNVPPLLVFPRKYFKDHMIKNAPPGTVGTASPSGWMTCDIFVQWLKHFILHAKPSPDAPILLIMDNHESHVSLEVIKLAKANNIILLTLPPHTSHKLQPLDKCVYGPLKKFYNQSCQTWLLNNAGKRITIYDIAEILGECYPLAFTTRNCTAGFRSTGIIPFNNMIFSDEDFMAAAVTDIPVMEEGSQTENEEISNHDRVGSREVTPENRINQSCHSLPNNPSCSDLQHNTPEKEFISPHMIKPYPTASFTSTNKRQRKKKTTEILTSTPVYKRLEKEQHLKNAKKSSLKKMPEVKRQITKCLGQ